MDYRFCYRIEKEAGMAHYPETGQPSECYAQLEFTDSTRVLTDEEYNELHLKFKSSHIAKGMLLPEHVTLISVEEYDREMEEEEDE